MKYFKAAVVCMAMAIFLLEVSVAATPKAKETLPAPIPAQILTAKRVFVGNAGGDERMDDDPHFTGGPERAYNQFYAAIKGWGRYEVVASPGDAELLLEIKFIVFPADQAGRGNSLVGAIYDPQLRVVILDPKTHAALWGLTEHVEWAILQGNRDKNFDKAIAKVVSEVQRIGAQPAANEGEKKN